MAIAYQTLPDGTVQKLAADGVSWETPWPSDPEIALYEKSVARWESLAVENSDRTGVPAPWILAVIYGESGGNPNAHGPPYDYGIGLMMITSNSLKQGHSNAEVFDPGLNVKLGTDFMATNMKLGGTDLPQNASMFNAGSPGHGAWSSSTAPWGWREYKIPSTGQYPYISKLVRISNYVVSQSVSRTGPPNAAFPPALVFIGIAFATYLASRYI